MLSRFSPSSQPASTSYHSNLHPQHQQDEVVSRKRSLPDVEENDQNQQSGGRRRISRACDQCNQLRTKCDGNHPCKHCQENQLQCKYARAHKKRGRAPKREQEQNDAVTGVANSVDAEPNNIHTHSGSTANSGTLMTGGEKPLDNAGHWSIPLNGSSTHRPRMNYSAGSSQDLFGANGLTVPTSQNNNATFSLPAFSDFPLTDYSSAGMSGFEFPLGDDYSVAFMGKPPTFESPEFYGMTPSMFAMEPQIPAVSTVDSIKYPVLKPLLPHLGSILSVNQACTLLEQYFSSSTPAYLRPVNPYLPANIFRKKSILHPTEPRPCTPALLASMVWIAAQTSDATFLTVQIDTRARICQRLLDLIVNHLKPLIHTPTTSTSEYGQVSSNDAGLGSLVHPTDRAGIGGHDAIQIDNLATYIHLATVVSASERKAASLRWWNAAWALAREIRLCRELPPNPPEVEDGYSRLNGNDSARPLHSEQTQNRQVVGQSVSEEQREERRRVWWLLFMQDRHLALCYNRPMFFLNKECENLLQPMDDDLWQSDRFREVKSSDRKLGLIIECTSHSVFGFFLPLMIILGEILGLNYARNRPVLLADARRPKTWDDDVAEITECLERYEKSLETFSQMAEVSKSPLSVTESSNIAFNESEISLRTRTVVAYGKHISHVLHILLTGKWDPIALLDDNDLWISSQAFVTATGHAVGAAQAVGEVIEHDPDLSLMPYFFGIYLLQGSFLLLLFADKLAGNVSTEVVKACETIVRAHEACLTTLDTQYQRNFRKVMRSALQQVRGRLADNMAEQQSWRRQILAMYRWTSDGTGLAL